MIKRLLNRFKFLKFLLGAWIIFSALMFFGHEWTRSKFEKLGIDHEFVETNDKLESFNFCESNNDCTIIYGSKKLRCYYLINVKHKEESISLINSTKSEIQKECFGPEYASGVICSEKKCMFGG